jgi:hypothetical protein
MVLTFMLDQAKQGKLTIIATGHKKTRVGYFPALQAEGVATCTTTLFFLTHNGFIEAVRSGPALKGEEAYDDVRYRLTAKGEQALGAEAPSGVATTMTQWRRRVESRR